VIAVTGRQDRYQLYQHGSCYNLPGIRKRPLVRAIGDEGVLVISNRPCRGKKNAAIYNKAGQISHRFTIGYDIREVVSFTAIIAVGYGDTVYGNNTGGFLGLVLLDLDGNIIFTDYEMVHCYGACARSDHQLLYLSYPRFMLIQVDVRTLAVEEWLMPEELQGATAVTSFKDEIFLHSPYHDENGLYRWQLGENSFERIGEYSRPLRGLRNGRFIAMLETECVELSVIE